MVVAYFSSRHQRVKVGTAFSEYVETCDGGPQGSVIMLFAWLVYINDISVEITDCNFRIFVDDLSIYVADESPERDIARMDDNLQRIYNWSITNHNYGFQVYKISCYRYGG